MKTRRINLKKMGVRGGTEIVSIVIEPTPRGQRILVAIDYSKDTSLGTRALLVTSLFRDIVTDIARANPGHKREIFHDVRALVDAELERQQKGLG